MYGKVRGFGGYKIQQNSLQTGGLSPPQIVNSIHQGSVIVRHREFIGDITGNATFTNSQFPLNPGLFNSFPWLSQIAGAFEQYRWRGLIFEYKSTSVDSLITGQATPSMGSVIMATDYNSPDGNQFIDKLTMENAEFSNSCRPSHNMIHPIECKNSLNPLTRLWIRNGGISANQDLRLYDLGSFNIATVGFPTGGPFSSVGELWATYEIEFYKTKFKYDEAVDCAFDRFTLAPTFAVTSPFGTSTASSRNTLGGTLSSTLYTLPSTTPDETNYIWSYQITGLTAAANVMADYTGYTVTLGAGLTAVTNWVGPAGAGTRSSVTNVRAGGNGATDLSITGMFRVSDPSGVLTLALVFGAGMIPTGTGQGGIFQIHAIPASFSTTV